MPHLSCRGASIPSCDDAGTSGAQRLEIFTGAGERRDWPPEVKVSIVAQSHSGHESTSAVARRHAMCPSQLFTWRRELPQADAGSRADIARHPGGRAAVRPCRGRARRAERRWFGRQASTTSAPIIAGCCGAGD
ncbi:transposase [Novosphingobium sp. 9U]|uniref:transposase n=1 Tax=Novosphingobium sp. 9U TaxID=2653158 RepID=UPI001F2D0976|nr:transposase [Novosphingobium sp. 9U]